MSENNKIVYSFLRHLGDVILSLILLTGSYILYRLRSWRTGYVLRKINMSGKKSHEHSSLCCEGWQSNVERLLYIRLDGIGDNVLAASMLSHIKQTFDKAKITVVCQELVANLYDACQFIDQLITINRIRFINNKTYRESVIHSLSLQNADVALNSTYSRDSLCDYVTLNSGAKNFITLDGDNTNIDVAKKLYYDKFYSKLIPCSASYKSELDRHKDFLRGLGITVIYLRPVIWLSEEDESFADEFFELNNLEHSRTIALFSGVQSNIRLYYNYGIAISKICRGNSFSVIAFGSEKDKSINQAQCESIGAKCINMSGRTTIRKSAAILKRCRLAVGAETGLAHISCAVGIHNVIIIGGGHFGRFMPYSNLTSIVCLPLDCYKCNWHCKYKRPFCIESIHPDVLSESIRQTLASDSERPRIFIQRHFKSESGKFFPDWSMNDQEIWHSDYEYIYI